MARRRLGRVPAPVAITAHHGGVLKGLVAFGLAMERSRRVPAALKTLVCIKAAALVGCRFCIDIGSSEALRHGVSEAKLLALVSYEDSPLFSEQERMALRLTEQLTATPATPDPALVRALEASLGTAALVELTAMIAWENYRARFNHAVGAEEEGYSDKRVCVFPPRHSASTTPEFSHEAAARMMEGATHGAR